MPTVATIALWMTGLAIAGLAFAGYASPEFQVLLANGIPFCN